MTECGSSWRPECRVEGRGKGPANDSLHLPSCTGVTHRGNKAESGGVTWSPAELTCTTMSHSAAFSQETRAAAEVLQSDGLKDHQRAEHGLMRSLSLSHEYLPLHKYFILKNEQNRKDANLCLQTQNKVYLVISSSLYLVVFVFSFYL